MSAVYRICTPSCTCMCHGSPCVRVSSHILSEDAQSLGHGGRAVQLDVQTRPLLCIPDKWPCPRRARETTLVALGGGGAVSKIHQSGGL